MKLRFALLLVVLLGQSAFSQMTYSYSTYTTNTADQNHFYVTAVVDGSATCNNVHIQSLNCAAVTHQGQVYVSIGNVSGWQYGPAGNPNNYISVSNAQTLDDPVVGTDYSETTTAQIDCSVAGLVFLQSVVQTVGFRDSAYKFYIQYPGGQCGWNQTCNGTCSVQNYTTNPVNGQCYTPPFQYRQCTDLVINGDYCLYRRVSCIGQSLPGICS